MEKRTFVGKVFELDLVCVLLEAFWMNMCKHGPFDSVIALLPQKPSASYFSFKRD